MEYSETIEPVNKGIAFRAAEAREAGTRDTMQSTL